MDPSEILARPGLEATSWSVLVRPLDGPPRFAHDPERLLPTASVAKVFLLVEVADAVLSGRLTGDHPVSRSGLEPVADSGLWQHLDADALTVADAARLVGSVSDNLATNALLDLVGLEAVRERARELAPGGSMLLDRVRDVRTPEHPSALSVGCAADWVGVLAALAAGEVVDVAVSRLVLDWLGLGVDLSMVAGALGLDPLAHAEPDRGLLLWHKTGTDAGVRADVGLVAGERTVAYAVLCGWDPAEGEPRDEVLAAMRDLGGLVRRWAEAK